MTRDCQGFHNLCGLQVGYGGVGVQVGFLNPYQTHTLGTSSRVAYGFAYGFPI